MLRLERLEKAHPGPSGPVPALRGVSLEVAAGERVALLGESGSGKSTLLHLAAGLETPDAGRALLEGVDLAALPEAGRAALRAARIGVVFQSFNLIPSLRAGQDIAFQARLAGRHDPARCARLAARLGLSALLDRYPEQLSGGQQQRVAIARALAPAPALLLADEPTGALDAATAAQVLALMVELCAESGAALLMATHSEQAAAAMTRRLRLVDGRLA